MNFKKFDPIKAGKIALMLTGAATIAKPVYQVAMDINSLSNTRSNKKSSEEAEKINETNVLLGKLVEASTRQPVDVGYRSAAPRAIAQKLIQEDLL